MIELSTFKDWAAKQLQEKTCKRVKQAKQKYKDSILSEDSATPKRIYTTKEYSNLSYAVQQKACKKP